MSAKPLLSQGKYQADRPKIIWVILFSPLKCWQGIVFQPLFWNIPDVLGKNYWHQPPIQHLGHLSLNSEREKVQPWFLKFCL